MINTFLFKVVYWDEIDEKESVMHHLLRASSFSEAVEELERYYVDTIVSLEVECFEDACGQIPESAIDAVRHCYREEN